MKMPATVYTVLTDFPKLGLGNAGDASECRETAYSQYVESVEDAQPVCVIELSFDVETGALETARDVTSDFSDEYAENCERRGIAIAAE